MTVRVLRDRNHRHLLFQVWESTWRGPMMVVECAHCDYREWWTAIEPAPAHDVCDTPKGQPAPATKGWRK